MDTNLSNGFHSPNIPQGKKSLTVVKPKDTGKMFSCPFSDLPFTL